MNLKWGFVFNVIKKKKPTWTAGFPVTTNKGVFVLPENLTPPDNASYLTAKGFCLTSAVWMMVATLIGLVAAIELVAPDLTANIAWLLFSRLRPIHVNLVLFGFVTPGLLASAFYFVPRLLRTGLYSEKLGILTVVLWNIALVALMISLAAGFTQGREYAEMIWPIDVAIVFVFGLVFFNFAMT
ncbi:MAG: hypothetical protein HN888_01010, partial [Desulfobacula sp.]|nr:hypothetical protein [Desulfobacula sp.]